MAYELGLEDLEDEAFKALPPEEQYKGRLQVFRSLQKDPEFRALPLEERSKVLHGEQAPAEKPGFLVRAGRKFVQEGENLANLPDAAKRLVTGEGGRGKAALETLSGVSAPFNVLTAPIGAAAENAAANYLSEEWAERVGTGAEIASTLGLGLLGKAGKLSQSGMLLNELMGVTPGRNPANPASKFEFGDKLKAGTRSDLFNLNTIDEADRIRAQRSKAADDLLEQNVLASDIDAQAFLQDKAPRRGGTPSNTNVTIDDYLSPGSAEELATRAGAAVDIRKSESQRPSASQLLDEAARSQRVEPQGNATLRAAEQNTLRGKPDVAETLGAEELEFQKWIDEVYEAEKAAEESPVKLDPREFEAPKAEEVVPTFRTGVTATEGATGIVDDVAENAASVAAKEAEIQSPKIEPQTVEAPTAKPAADLADDAVQAEIEKLSILDKIKEGFKGETGAIGNLSPEQLAVEQRARLARRSLYADVTRAAQENGLTLTEAGKKLGISESIVGGLTREVGFEEAGANLQKIVSDIEGLNNSARMIYENQNTIKNTGTLPKDLRPEFRETGRKPETFSFRASEEDIATSKAKAIATAQEIVKIRSSINDLRATADIKDPITKNTLSILDSSLAKATKALNKLGSEQRKLRFAAGRMVRSFQYAVPEEVLSVLQDAAVMLPKVGAVRDRMIGWRHLAEQIKNKSISPADAALEFKDIVKLNFFTIGSPVLDVLSNSTELGAQAVAGVGKDLVRVTKGDVSFPSIGAIRETIAHRARINSEASEAMGMTAAGEPSRTAFVTKPAQEWPDYLKNLPDQLSSVPVRAKSMVDTVSKRVGYSMSLWRDALIEANQKNLSGKERTAFLDDFMANPPEAARDNALAQGKKAGFNRDLTSIERRIAGSTAFQTLAEAFASWSFQYARHATEMLGYNQPLFSKVMRDGRTMGWSKASAKNGEEIGGYLAKTATGVGGVMLVNNVIYDNVDFNTMEYKVPGGGRVRLRGLDSIQAPLILAAAMRGDWQNVTSAFMNSSLPGAGTLALVMPGQRGGGLVTGMLKQLGSAFMSKDIDPKGFEREFTDMLNRMIPGQGTLTAVKSLLDPVEREGLGRNLPGVSFAKDAQIDLTTGEEKRLTQRIPGMGGEVRNVSGTTIPGAARVENPVSEIFGYMGMKVKRGARTPIAGYNPSDMPDEVSRDYDIALGKARQRIIGPTAERMLAQINANPKLLKDQKTLDRMQATIKRLDNNAARVARREAGSAHNKEGRKAKKVNTLRVQRGPAAFRPEEQDGN
jgi:hypothetical protein